jgi:tRNA modification GTPase
MRSAPDTARATLITPPGEGGISVIALSGRGAAGVLESCFRGTRRRARDIPPGAIAHGHIVREGAALDEVIVAHFEGSASPTGEPIYEVNCHGGAMAARAVLGRLGEAGAELVAWTDTAPGSKPGGRVLSPEAIRSVALAALPRAQTRLAARMLLAQAAGALSRELDRIRRDMSAGDAARIEALLQTAPLGEALLAPPTVMLAGPPNVGKSTLLNSLLHTQRVIVHPQPGTTRDVVRESVSIRGVPFELIDAAGIRGTAAGLEAEATKRAGELVRECDVVMLVFDARQGPAEGLRGLPSPQASSRRILVGNKIDLIERPPASGPLPKWLKGAAQVLISARDGRNLGQLEAALLEPYRPHIAACEQAGPVVFSRQIREALERIAAGVRQGGQAQALHELARLS